MRISRTGYAILAGWLICASQSIAAQVLEIHPALVSPSSAVDWRLDGVQVVASDTQRPYFALMPNGQFGNTDLRLGFDDGLTESPGWRVRPEGRVEFVDRAQARIGGGAISFIAPRGKLVLEPQRSTVFSPGQSPGDFSIAFWLRPVRADNGEIVLLYRSTLQFGSLRYAQQIIASFSQNRMNITFFNFFIDPAGSETTIRLHGRSLLVPNRWTHHVVRYDSTTGLLEYLADGQLEAVSYTTASSRQGGTVFTPMVGTSPRIELAPNYTGLLDEFVVSREYLESLDARRYAAAGGSIVSPVFDLGRENTLLTAITATDHQEARADVHYRYRFSDTSMGWTDDAPGWRPFIPGQSMLDGQDGPRGRYLQLAMNLYPDASREYSPLLSAIQVHYELDQPPPPPAYITARAGDGRISVQWSPVTESDVSGYMLYYGRAQGQYFGTGANEGSSPILIQGASTTSTVLSGLENGTLYFIAVATIDSADPPHIGEFSSEVHARPARISR